MDILVTHTPPFVEDWNVDVSLQTQSPHFGSRALAATLARVKPKLAFCGHIHTGDHRVHDLVHENGQITKIYNVSRLNEDYAVALNEREVALMRWFAGHPGEVFSRDFLFTKFWGASFDGTDSTLSIAILRLREKLGESAAGLKAVRGSGYAWRP